MPVSWRIIIISKVNDQISWNEIPLKIKLYNRANTIDGIVSQIAWSEIHKLSMH